MYTLQIKMVMNDVVDRNLDTILTFKLFHIGMMDFLWQQFPKFHQVSQAIYLQVNSNGLVLSVNISAQARFVFAFSCGYSNG